MKIFDEILVNAIDQYSLHPKKVSKIEVTVSNDGSILIENSGVSIPIKKHETEKGVDGKPMWIPELIFGHLLTSSNYNDAEHRVTGGRNGYGAKLANVFSSQFWIKISDGKKTYYQKWESNMSRCLPPTIEASTNSACVTIGLVPDWPRFGGIGDFKKVAEVRTWDAAMWCSKAKINFNSKLLEVKSLEDYARMHIGDVQVARMHTENFDVVVGHSTSGQRSMGLILGPGRT